MVAYSKPTSETDLEAWQAQQDGTATPPEDTPRSFLPPGHDGSKYLNVSPEYVNYANATEKPVEPADNPASDVMDHIRETHAKDHGPFRVHVNNDGDGTYGADDESGSAGGDSGAGGGSALRHASSIAFGETSVSVDVGETDTTQDFTAVPADGGAAFDISALATYESSDVTVATVTDDGHAVGVAVGTCTITGSYDAKSSVYDVTVIAAA